MVPPRPGWGPESCPAWQPVPRWVLEWWRAKHLAHHFLDGNSGDANVMPQAQPMDTAWDTQADNMGGTDFGIADNTSWDDNSGFADISGGDDWS